MLVLFAELAQLAKAGKACTVEIEWYGWLTCMQLRVIVLQFNEGTFLNVPLDDIYRALALQLAQAMFNQSEKIMREKYSLTLDRMYSQVWIWIFLTPWGWMCGSTPYLQHITVTLRSHWHWDIGIRTMGTQPEPYKPPLKPVMADSEVDVEAQESTEDESEMDVVVEQLMAEPWMEMSCMPDVEAQESTVNESEMGKKELKIKTAPKVSKDPDKKPLKPRV